MNSKWRTAEQYGEHIGKSKRTIWRMMEKGLPYTKIGQSRMIHMDIAEDWLLDQMTTNDGTKPMAAEHHANQILKDMKTEN